MNIKKALPVILFVLLGILAIALKRCNSKPTATKQKQEISTASANNAPQNAKRLDRNTTDLFFTKHAKCRMQCRQISQQEVRDILINGTVNYNKSDLNDAGGPTYAIEGTTKDRQHIRIIFAPKQKHLTVVTVIDLDHEHQCDC